jgi:aspartyl-tRNA(Asn)/glutamyl-tRNA(Gln) amidotransferase subunit C
MAITREDIAEVAHLSRLEMDAAELDKFTEQLQGILEYASMLNELDMADVEPTFHAVPMKNVFREDIVKPSLPIEDVLGNAPDPVGNFFGVPRIIDEGEGA